MEGEGGVFFGEVKKEEQSRTFPRSPLSKRAPQARLKVQPQLSQSPQSKGWRPLFLHALFSTSLDTPPSPLPKF